MPYLFAINGLHFCHAAIHKQFGSRDVAAVVGCEKHCRLGDLIGCTEPAERNTAGGKTTDELTPIFSGSKDNAAGD